MIKAFIFDLDGVITDTAEYHYLAWKKLADMNNLKFNREINEELRGVSRVDSLNIILRENDTNISNDKKLEWATLKNNLYVESIKDITPKDLLPGVGELLKELKTQGFKIGLGSASKNAKPVIERLGIADLFDVVGDGHSVERSKPAPDLFIHVAKELAMKCSECIVVEDAEAGVQAAIDAGMKVIGIGDAQRVRAADYIYEGAGDIEIKKVTL